MMFTDAYVFVAKEEGGYVNDPADSGGATNGGVTQATYDSFRKRIRLDARPVRYITRVEKEQIFAGIWKDCKADLLPAGLNLMHFDFAVNAGNNRAAKTLQATLAVEEDGKIGPQTLAAIGGKDVEVLIIEYAAKREQFYRSLAERRPKDQKFLRGWLLRTKRCTERALGAYRAANRDQRSNTV
jgi:lysozyme family protein